MKVYTRIITLAFALILSMTNIVFATQTTEEKLKDEIDSLKSQVEGLLSSNSNLNAIINSLEEQLEDVQKNPTKALPKRPVLLITDPLVVEIEAGKNKTIEFTMKNLTSDTAKNVTTTFSFPSNSGISGGFTDKNSNISSMGNKASRKMSIEIKTHESTEEGFYTLTLTHKYLNDNNEESSNESIVTVKVVGSSTGGGASLKNIKASKESIAPGESFDLSAVIENAGKTAIKDISVTIDGMSPESIFLRGSTNVVDVSTLQAGISHNLSIGFTTNSKAKKGSYPLTLKLSYTDSSSTSQTKSYTYYVNVSSSQSNENAAEVVITDITYPTATMGVGQEFSMTATIKNISGYTAKNVKISAVPQVDGEVVPKSTNISTITQLAAGEERQFTYRFAATSNSKTRNYVIGFEAQYETGLDTDDGKKEVNMFTQFQGVNVSNPEADKKEEDEKKTSTPKIIVSSYKSDPIIVRAGQEFDLDMTFLNTSGEKSVKNIKVVLSVEEEVTSGAERKGSVFTPVDSSNTFFIDSIAPKGEVSEHIRMYTLPDASPKNYIIVVKMEYEDAENNSYEALENVGINVKQVTKLDTSEISIDQYGMLYQPIYVNFEFYNTGKVTLSNLMIKVEGKFDSNQSSMYYGSFSPSSTDYYDNQIIPTEEGTQTLALVISYEDGAGELIEERKEYVIEVSAPMPMEPGLEPGMMEPGMQDMVWDEKTGMMVPAKQGLSTPVKIAMGATAAVVVGAAAFIGFRLKKKKQERIDLDE